MLTAGLWKEEEASPGVVAAGAVARLAQTTCCMSGVSPCVALENRQVYVRADLAQRGDKSLRPLHACDPEVGIPCTRQVGRISVITPYADPRRHCIEVGDVEGATTIPIGQITHPKGNGIG